MRTANYDKEQDILTVMINGSQASEVLEEFENLVVDFSKNGTILQIEMPGFSKQKNTTRAEGEKLMHQVVRM